MHIYRHYTFYIWKNVFARYAAARFCLVPLYMYSVWSLWDSITCQLHMGAPHDSTTWHQSKPCALLLTLCTVMTLIPAWLIEFRCVPLPSDS